MSCCKITWSDYFAMQRQVLHWWYDSFLFNSRFGSIAERSQNFRTQNNVPAGKSFFLRIDQAIFIIIFDIPYRPMYFYWWQNKQHFFYIFAIYLAYFIIYESFTVLTLKNHQICQKYDTKWRKNLIRLALNPFFHGPFTIIAIITSTYIQFLIFRLALLRCTTTRNYFSNSSLNDQRPWDSKDPTLNILLINGFTT